MLGSSQGKPRTWFGDASILEIAVHLTVIIGGVLGAAVLLYGLVANGPSEKEEQELRTKGAAEPSAQVEQLVSERTALQTQLEIYQAQAAFYRKGIVLSYLAEHRRQIEREAREHRAARSAFDLQAYCMAYTQAQLARLGAVEPGSPKSYEHEALRFLRSFAEARIPAESSDPAPLADLLNAFDRQG